MEKRYTEEEKVQVLKLHTQGMRPYKISAFLKHSISVEVVSFIINDFKKESYLEKQINGISYRKIINLYSCEEKELFEILYIYPELTFGQIKNIIEQFYHMQSIKKPRTIKFPKKAIEDYMKTHSIEEVCIEFGYTNKELTKRLQEAKNIENMSKEELMNYRVQILMNDIKNVEDGICSKNRFKKKYKGLNPKMAKSLVEQYRNNVC